MQHSHLQKLQKARAYFKFVITGMFKPVQTSYLTAEENEILEEIGNLIKKLIVMHDNNSRTLGLKVPLEKCHISNCRKEATHKLDIGRFCEKHYKQIVEE